MSRISEKHFCLKVAFEKGQSCWFFVWSPEGASEQSSSCVVVDPDLAGQLWTQLVKGSLRMCRTSTSEVIRKSQAGSAGGLNSGVEEFISPVSLKSSSSSVPSCDPTYFYKSLTPGRLDRRSPDLQVSAGFFSCFCFAELQPLVWVSQWLRQKTYMGPAPIHIQKFIYARLHVTAQAGLELTMLPRITLNFWSSCLHNFLRLQVCTTMPLLSGDWIWGFKHSLGKHSTILSYIPQLQIIL